MVAKIDDGQIDKLYKAIQSISHGDKYGPAGLEMLTMALSGDGGADGSIAAALNNIAESNREIAVAIDYLANTIEHHGDG